MTGKEFHRHILGYQAQLQEAADAAEEAVQDATNINMLHTETGKATAYEEAANMVQELAMDFDDWLDELKKKL